MLKRNGIYGLAEVYVRCKRNGYTRSFGSMCKQIRKRDYIKPKYNVKATQSMKEWIGDTQAIKYR